MKKLIVAALVIMSLAGCAVGFHGSIGHCHWDSEGHHHSDHCK